jgi:very-short-patch-repair endonuclease
MKNEINNSPSLKGWQAKPDGLAYKGPKTLPTNIKLKQRARELRKAGNLSEVLFWQQVRNKKFIELDFDRQKIIGNYIVDFFVKSLGLVIEIDGSSHDSKIEYDKERENYLKSLGLKIFRIPDIEVKKNLDGVMYGLKGFIKDNWDNANWNNSPLLEGCPKGGVSVETKSDFT